MLKKLIFLLLCFMQIFIAFAYLPSNYLDESLYSRNSTLITLLFGGVLGLTMIKHFFSKTKIKFHSLFRKLITILLILCLEFFFLFALSLNMNTNDLLSLIMVVVAIYIGYVNDFSIKQIKLFILIIVLSSLYLGYEAINVYVGAFDLYASDWQVMGKNQIGQLISFGVILSYVFFIIETKKITKYLMLILFFILFSFLIIVKCKTAILAVFISVSIISFKSFNKETFKKYLLFGMPILILFLVIYADELILGVFELLGLEFGASVNELTTGRSSRNIEALQYIKNNPFQGELLRYSNILMIHNWILIRAVRYGVLLVLPMLIFYLMILFFGIREIYKTRLNNFFQIGCFLLIVPYISSFAEPGAPFSPGTMFCFIYVFLGIYLRNIQITNKQCKS
ncbi:MAG: hypothetical protein IKV46_08055 [Bacteroidales bacterium]|nr:hypothetical protein [Bacteroidales bacterium]